MSCNVVVSCCEREKYFSISPACCGVPTISSVVSRSRRIKAESFRIRSNWSTLSRKADRIFVPDLLRNDIPPAEDGEVTLAAAALFGRLGNEEIGKMIQERPFIKMKLEAAVQKAHLIFLRVGLIILFQEPVLPVYYRVIRQYLDCLCSCAVHGCIVCGSDCEQLRKKDLEADSHVRVFGEDASFFHGQDGKLTFQRCGF